MTLQSVGLLWTKDRPVTETSTWQHTALKRDRHPRPRCIRTRNPSKRSTADPRLKPLGHLDQQALLIYKVEIKFYMKEGYPQFVKYVELSHDAPSLACFIMSSVNISGSVPED